MRLLSFSGPKGKRAHLITDGTPTPLSLLADHMEEQQIKTAAVIVSLTDVLTICESRGQRIPEYAELECPAIETDSMD